MYWNNPIQEIDFPPDNHIIFNSQHGGQHCLFYDPAVSVDDIAKQTTLQGLCDWANTQLEQHGRGNFTLDPDRHYDAANLIKINQMVDSVARYGSVKPMLLHYQGSLPYTTGTGDTRLRAIERLPDIKTVAGLISTHSRYRDQFDHCQEITNMAEFAGCFGANKGRWLIRLTDEQAPYGIDWYEFVLNDPAVKVPSWDFCLRAIQNYINSQPEHWRFRPEWFDQKIDWSVHAADN